ncbi:MAG: hypothetical protein GY801_35450 [bacterium]|nr:hypothetical protein [bacterium]
MGRFIHFPLNIMTKRLDSDDEFVPRKNFALSLPDGEGEDDLSFWMEAYFRLAVTTAESSRKVQRRDIDYFLEFVRQEVGRSDRSVWTPRLSRAFVEFLRSTIHENGKRRWGDVTINRILAHLKTFATWVHQQAPFPLGAPMDKLSALSVPTVLAIEKALNLSEQRQMLDAADLLLDVGWRSKNRRAHAGKERPRRKGYRLIGSINHLFPKVDKYRRLCSKIQ